MEVLPEGGGARFWVETVLLIALLIGVGVRAYVTAAAHNARVCASVVCEEEAPIP